MWLCRFIHTCKGNHSNCWKCRTPAGRTEAQLLAARQADETDKEVTFKNCAPFTKCISRINNTDIDNAHDIDIVMPMYNLLEYSDNYSKTSGSLWQYYKDDPNDNLADFLYYPSKMKMIESCIQHKIFQKWK